MARTKKSENIEEIEKVEKAEKSEKVSAAKKRDFSVIELKKNPNIFKKSMEEYYNVIRTNILYSGEENRVIAITSTKENEGKTTTSLNVAISLANVGLRVLFIDADLRHSVLRGKIKYRKRIDGLTRFLSGLPIRNGLEIPTDIEGLDIVPAGHIPPNAPLLLENKAFGELLQGYKKIYDYVIIDTPPIGIVVDAFIIAKKADSVIYIVNSGEIKKKDILKNKQLLEKTGANYLGVILTKHKVEKSAYGYGYGYGYGNYPSENNSNN